LEKKGFRGARRLIAKPRLMPHIASQISRLLLAVLLLSLQVARGSLDLASLENVETRVRELAARVTPSVVTLTHGEQRGLATGSGVIIAPNGLILTAAHVVSDSKAVDVIFPDGKTVHAKVLGANYDRDVALAQINEPGNYPFVELGETKDLAVGNMVVALGHPGGFDPQRKPPVRFGRVFEFNRDRYIRSDCTLASGDSGGPLFDLSGKVIGIHSSVGTDMSVNNSAPVEVVRRDWERLMKGERWGTNPLAETTKLSKGELAGLDLERFRQRVIAEGTKNKGWFEANPKTIARWLTECGMRKRRVNAMDSADLLAFMRKALGGLGEVAWSQDSLDDSSVPKISEKEFPGLDPKKFRERLRTVSEKNGGMIAIKQDTLAKWLRECGMTEERINAATPSQLAELLQTLLGYSGQPTAEEKAIQTQDGEVIAAIKPGLEKVVPSVVRLMKGTRTIALGTIVRENGFILTKHSEIAKGKEALQARLSDGRTFPATAVQQFAEHDLALVKIDAKSLPTVNLPELESALIPGSLLFTPSAQKRDPMLAMGVVSVANRSLKESGGYLGVGLNENSNAVEISVVVPNSPAARAGLQKKDQILSLDSLTFQMSAELSKHIRSLEPNAKVQLTYRRGREEKTVEITLGDRAKLPKRMANADPGITLGTEVSAQRWGYPMIFQHDQPLNPEDCGSVLVDLHGSVVGVNIARVGRVDTYAIPADFVARLLKTVDFDALAEKGSPRS
jgi:S1-C subfamily serine protease